MKTKQLLRWLTLVIIVLGVFSCKDDKEEEVTPVPPVVEPGTETVLPGAEWTFSGEAGTYQLMVAAAEGFTWSVSSDATWIELDKTSGSGEVLLGVKVTENTTGAQRTGTITVKSADKVVMTFKIIQEAVEQVLRVTSEDTIRDIPATGKAIVIDVEANTDYSFELQPWVNVVAAPSAAGVNTPFALTKSKITLNVAPNAGSGERTSAVVIKQGDKEVKKVVLLQLGAVHTESLEINVNELTDGAEIQVPALGGNLEIKVASNINYECILMAWSDSKLMSAGTEEKIESNTTIMLDANFTFGERRRALMIMGGEGEQAIQKAFTLVQSPVDIQVTTFKPIPAIGREAGYLKVVCPEGVLYRVSGNFPGIYHDTDLDKPAENLLAFKVESDNTDTQQKAYPVVLEFYKGEEFNNTVACPQHLFYLTQAKLTPLGVVTANGVSLAGGSLTVDSMNAAPVKIIVSAEGECEYGLEYITGAEGWLTITGPTEVEGENENLHYYEYELSFADNEETGMMRNVSIDFYLKGYENIKTAVSVWQKKRPLPVAISSVSKVTVNWDQDYTQANIDAFNGGTADVFLTNEPVGSTWEATVTEGDFQVYPTKRYVLVYGKTKNETGSPKTGKLVLTLKDKDGNVLATCEVPLVQEANPDGPVGPVAPQITIDLEGTEFSIVDRPLSFYANGSTTGYKVVAVNGMNIGWLPVTVNNENGMITIETWEGPGSITIAIVPGDYEGSDFSNYPQITIRNSN